MKNHEQANNNNNLNDPTVARDPQTLVEDLPMSGEQEERVKGGYIHKEEIPIESFSWGASNQGTYAPVRKKIDISTPS